MLRFLVALAPVRDLFIFAKHKFAAARRHIVFARHFAATTLLPLRKNSFHPPPPAAGYPLQQKSDDPIKFWNGKLQSLCAHCHESRKKRLEHRGYEDVNDAERLRHDPAMRWIVGGKAAQSSAASPSQMRLAERLSANS